MLQRVNDRTAFEKVALQYVVQFERSAPAWEEGLTTTACAKTIAGGYIPVTGSSPRPAASQLEGLKRAIAKKIPHARLDLASVIGFDDIGARLLAEALAYARKHRFALTFQRPEKLQVAVDAVVKRGKDGGEGAWLLSLELLQFQHKQAASRRPRDRVCNRVRAIAAVLGATAGCGSADGGGACRSAGQRPG